MFIDDQVTALQISFKVPDALFTQDATVESVEWVLIPFVIKAKYVSVLQNTIQLTTEIWKLSGSDV